MKNLPNIEKVKDIRKLEDMGAEVEFTPEEEQVNPADMYDDDDNVEYVRQQYNSGNSAAWFCAKVTVTYKGMEANDYLGCCSYKSFREFTSDGSGYYKDMVNRCIDEINSDIDGYNAGIRKQWNIRKATNMIRPYGLHIVSLTLTY